MLLYTHENGSMTIEKALANRCLWKFSIWWSLHKHQFSSIKSHPPHLFSPSYSRATALTHHLHTTCICPSNVCCNQSHCFLKYFHSLHWCCLVFYFHLENLWSSRTELFTFSIFVALLIKLNVLKQFCELHLILFLK